MIACDACTGQALAIVYESDLLAVTRKLRAQFHHQNSSMVLLEGVWCTQCHREFSSDNAAEQHKTSLAGHGQGKHRIAHWQCAKCRRAFASEASGKAHLRQQGHGAQRHKNGKVTCACCSKLIKSEQGLLQHMRIHRDTWTCGMCAKAFSTPQAHDQHMNAKHPHQTARYGLTAASQRFLDSIVNASFVSSLPVVVPAPAQASEPITCDNVTCQSITCEAVACEPVACKAAEACDTIGPCEVPDSCGVVTPREESKASEVRRDTVTTNCECEECSPPLEAFF